MIPVSRSLVPLSPARRAAMQAIAFVENRHERNVYCADYPYAHAFFRLLRGSRRAASVSSWISRWSDSQLHHTELEIMFYRWSERFPSLKSLDRWEMAGQPLWRLGAEAGFLSEESTTMTQELERWMVPNKLPLLRLRQCGVF